MARFGEHSGVVNCSFCGKTQKQVAKLIAGRGVYICNECVGLCNDIIEEGASGRPEVTEGSASPSAEDQRRWREALQALSGRLGRRPTDSELAAELGWTGERVSGAARDPWVAPSGVARGGVNATGLTGELREVQRQLGRLARRVAGLVEQREEHDRLRAGPSLPTPVFPDVAALGEVAEDRRLELRYDRSDDRLAGTVGGQPVVWHPVRDRRVAGRIGGRELEASWVTGNNYVPEPGGWTPGPDYVSDFPNIPARLTGSFAGEDVELHGVFHLDADYRFERGSIVGRIGAARLEATALAASGGLSDAGTVAVEGTYGSTPFRLYATIDGRRSRGMVHGTIEGATVHLDVSRPPIVRSSRPGRRAQTYPGSIVRIWGSYQGPPELLAVVVGTTLKFV